MKKTAFIIAIILTVVLTSCKKDRFFEPDKTPENMEQLTVPSSFDWKTTKDIQLTLSAPSNGIVEVSNSQNVAYQKAFLTPGQTYMMKLTLPSYEQNIKLKFLGQVVDIQVTGTSISYQF